MVKAESGNGIGCTVEGDGTIKEQINDLLNIIGALHRSFRRVGEDEAQVFRVTLLRHLLPGSKVWEQPEGEGYTVIKREEDEA